MGGNKEEISAAWTVSERLLLSHAVLKCGDNANSWPMVSRAMKSGVNNSRDRSFFSPKMCTSKLAELLEGSSGPRELAQVEHKLRTSRISELKKSIHAKEEQIKKVQHEIDEIKRGGYDQELLKNASATTITTAAPTPTSSTVIAPAAITNNEKRSRDTFEAEDYGTPTASNITRPSPPPSPYSASSAPTDQSPSPSSPEPRVRTSRSRSRSRSRSGSSSSWSSTSRSRSRSRLGSYSSSCSSRSSSTSRSRSRSKTPPPALSTQDETSTATPPPAISIASTPLTNSFTPTSTPAIPPTTSATATPNLPIPSVTSTSTTPVLSPSPSPTPIPISSISAPATTSQISAPITPTTTSSSLSTPLVSPIIPKKPITQPATQPHAPSPIKATPLQLRINLADLPAPDAPSPSASPLLTSPRSGTSTPPLTPTGLTEEERKRRQLKKVQTAALLKVWRAIWQHRSAIVFRHPVTLEDAPDYDQIIRCRMDLSTLKKRLEDGEIASSMDFYRDLMLMFHNAMIYNTKDSDVYGMAVTLKKFAVKEMEGIFATEELLKSPHPVTRSRAPSGLAEKKLTPRSLLKRSGDETIKIEDGEDAASDLPIQSPSPSSTTSQSTPIATSPVVTSPTETTDNKNNKKGVSTRSRKLSQEAAAAAAAAPPPQPIRKWKRSRNTTAERTADEEVDIMED